MAEFEASCAMIMDLMNGRAVSGNGKELELHGPRTGRGSRSTSPPTGRGRSGSRADRDGVIIQLADPIIIQWLAASPAGCRRGGRDPDELECLVCGAQRG